MKNYLAKLKTLKTMIIWLVALGAFFVMSDLFCFSGWYHLIYDDTYEIAIRTSCASNQSIIFRQLVEYQKEYNTLPDDLGVLLEEGYITEKELYCPNLRRLKTKGHPKNEYAYLYYPENFGDKDKVLISENIHNHFGPPLRLKHCQPVVNQIMGDGSRNKKILDPEIFK